MAPGPVVRPRSTGGLVVVLAACGLLLTGCGEGGVSLPTSLPSINLPTALPTSLPTLRPTEEPSEEPSPVVSGKTDAFPVSSDFVPRLGVASELVRAVAGMDAPGLVGQVFEVGDAFVVAEVLTREKPDLSKLGETERGEIRERLLQRKRNEAIQAFVEPYVLH